MKQFLEYWLEVHRKFVRVNTYRIYRQYLDKHILPVLGHVRLQKLTPRHIQELYGRDLNEGYAPETIRGVHRMLHKALSDAVQWSWVATNACDKVKQPGPVRYETNPLTLEQAKTLMETAKGSRLEALLTLAVTTGMRRGEILALRWSDIDFGERSLQVRRTVNRAGKYGLLENAPKTEKSKRRIMLPQFVLDVLIEHRARQDAIRLKADLTWQDHNLVFSTDAGNFVEGANLDRRFKRLLKEAGLPDMRFHDLRHSAATILLGRGVHPKLVQELLGHSQMSITMDRYSHVLPSMQRDMMKGLDDLYGGG
jgi:integrase